MINAIKIIHLVSNTPGFNDKQYLLKKNEKVEGLKEILKAIYNPYHKTGISTNKFEDILVLAASSPMSASEIDYRKMIEYFKTHQTGTDADLVFSARFVRHMIDEYSDVPFALEVARGIITQDLQIGVSAKTLNTVFGKNFIPMINCMLGRKFEDYGPDKVTWPCIVTEKLDGIRRLLIKENGVCRFYSRAGHEDTGLIDILKEAKYLPDNRVYDGELLAAGVFSDSIALRQATNSIGNSKGNKTGLEYHIFDMVSVEDFWAGRSTETAYTRKVILGATLMDDSISKLDLDEWPKYIAGHGVHVPLQYIKSVPILGMAKNMADVEHLVEPIWERGGEGVMLNTVNGLYESKRSKELLKLKKTKEYTLTVVDMIEGTGKFEETLGALIVEYKGYRLGVGSGFTDAQRHHIWDNSYKYIGQQIEIDSFGESTNVMGGVSLNCPIFKRFVGVTE